MKDDQGISDVNVTLASRYRISITIMHTTTHYPMHQGLSYFYVCMRLRCGLKDIWSLFLANLILIDWFCCETQCSLVCSPCMDCLVLLPCFSIVFKLLFVIQLHCVQIQFSLYWCICYCSFDLLLFRLLLLHLHRMLLLLWLFLLY